MDFEQQGLLDGLTGSERQARVELLTSLVEIGVPADELKQAAADGRLALLPLERLFTGDEQYTAREVAEQADVDLDFLLAMRRASGLPVSDPDAPLLNEYDLESARTLGVFVRTGLPEDGLLDVARIFGELTARTAATTRNFVAETLIGDGEDVDEHVLSIRLAETAKALQPLTISLIQYLYQLHTREQIRNEVAVTAQLQPGNVPGIQETSICFVDLVGFTSLGEEIPADELGKLAGRLGGLIAERVSAPVRLIKMIGDAGMLVSDDTDALLLSSFDLVDAAAEQGDDFPELKAGLARGEAIHKWGDWYGSPVNVASRVTSVARPGSVLVTQEVRDAVSGDYHWSDAGERKLKGVGQPVRLFRVRRWED